MACGWDRILACVGTSEYPGDTRKAYSERPAKAAGRSSRLMPRASARRLHQRNAVENYCWRVTDVRAQPSRRRWSCGRVVCAADFFGASPVASALGIRTGATPHGQSMLLRQAVVAVG